MANKRTLKKDINYLTYELISEVLVYRFYHPEADQNVLNEILGTLIENRNNLVGRINHINGKDNPKLVKQHFSSIRKDFQNSVTILDKLAKTKK
ncbi:MAG TPA: hypothetical protein PK252_06425 [Bacteroidales bacterium]|nr:hypothetical protein [Bacteroidales bacterium]